MHHVIIYNKYIIIERTDSREEKRETCRIWKQERRG